MGNDEFLKIAAEEVRRYTNENLYFTTYERSV